jgi:hypothetical protein
MSKIAATALMVAWSAAAAAQPHEGYLLGKWCGDRSNKYVTTLYFERNRFSITWQDTYPRRVNTVVRYELMGPAIRVIWINNGRETYTDYGNFRGDTMEQLPIAGFPLYIFRRC